MSTDQLEREIAQATGESLRTIRRRGFQLAMPLVVEFDPEPCAEPATIDWDEHYQIEAPRYRAPRRRLLAAA